MRRLALRPLVVALASLALGGCVVRGHPGDGAGSEAPAPNPGGGDPGGGDPGAVDAGPDHPGTQTGAQLYASLCASCHGDAGAGTPSAPALNRWTAPRDALVSTIQARMPQGDPQACTGDCASLVADFILDELQAATPSSCASVDLTAADALPPQALRLLTRDEYRRSVKDLLGLTETPCAATTDCRVESESCVEGACRADACDVVTFLYNPPGSGAVNTTVHVAGDFNGWAPHAADGVALAWSDALGLWWGKAQLPSGAHAYKLVLDDATWIADPRAQRSVSDGFGGQNSVVDVACDAGSGAADGGDFAARIPPDSHPETFPFASHAASGLVTPTHVDEYLQASARAVAAAHFDTAASAPRPGDAASVRAFGRRAFRRPLTDDEVTRYAALPSTTAIAQAMLSSPAFLYRSEIGAPVAGAAGDGGVFHLDPYETATALSYLFWGTTPDDALLDAAAAGALDGADGVEAQARRLLADPRAQEIMGAFALQWLGADKVITVDKSPTLYPSFDAAVRADLARETELYFSHVMFEGTGRYDELLTGTRSYVTPRTAALYGLGAPAGGADAPALVDMPADRRGVLSQASVMAATAHSEQTSPIHRGLFVRRRLLCQDLGTPPPNAGSVPDVDPSATTRERFAQHTANPFCASCHGYIDPVGFGFEGYDPVGARRSTENGLPVDDSGDMNDVEGLGTDTHAPFHSMDELAAILAGSASSKRCFVRQVVRFAQGRDPSTSTGETCALDALDQSFAGGDLKQLFIDVVRAPSFVMRRAP